MREREKERKSEREVGIQKKNEREVENSCRLGNRD